MKKYLLSLAVVLGLGSTAFAETVTVPATKAGDWTEYSWSKSGDDFTANVSNFTFTLIKNTSSSTLVSPDNGSIRVYAGAQLKIDAPSGYVMTKVEGVTAASTKATNVTVESPWNVTSEQFTAGANQNFSFEATTGQSSITFDGNGAQLRIKSLTITYNSTLSGDQKPAELSFSKSAVLVPEGQLYIEDIPVLNNPNNLPVTWSSSNEEVATVTDFGEGFVMVVPTGKAGTAVISVHSDATDEFGEGNASYTINVVPAANNIAELLEKAPKEKDKILVNCSLTVLFANGSYVYVTDEKDGYTLLWNPSHEYKAGDIIRGGWEATNAVYNNIVEFTGNFPEATYNYPVEYALTESVSLEDVNKVLYLNNVTFAENTPVFNDDNKTKTNFIGTLADGTEVTFRTNWNVESVPAGKYKVLCAVSSYKDAPQIFPISYDEPAVEVVLPDYPEHLEAACEGAEITYGSFDGVPETSVKVNTSAEKVTVALTLPEGWTGILHNKLQAEAGGDIDPLAIRRANEAEWTNVNDMVVYNGMVLGTELEVPANGDEYEVTCFLVLDDKVDMNNSYLVSVTATGAAVLEYPEYLTITSDATEVSVKNDNDFGAPNTTVTLKTVKEVAKVTVEIPEGWTAIWHSPIQTGDEGIGEASYRRAPEAAEWVPASTWEQFGFIKENEFEFPANGETVEFQCYLEKDGNVDSANQYLVSIIVNKDVVGAVDIIDSADADAVYYDLQGNKVANPANGIYVKVANGKAVKVVVK